MRRPPEDDVQQILGETRREPGDARVRRELSRRPHRGAPERLVVLLFERPLDSGARADGDEVGEHRRAANVIVVGRAALALDDERGGVLDQVLEHRARRVRERDREPRDDALVACRPGHQRVLEALRGGCGGEQHAGLRRAADVPRFLRLDLRVGGGGCGVHGNASRLMRAQKCAAMMVGAAMGRRGGQNARGPQPGGAARVLMCD